MLWNLCGKADKLWVKWVHVYYFKNNSVWDYQLGSSCSWTMRAILKSREKTRGLGTWEEALQEDSFPTRNVYLELRGPKEKAEWGDVFFKNEARPRAKFILWLLCHGRLSTKERLIRFGAVTSSSCCFCSDEESMEHVFFECQWSNEVWGRVLRWLQLDRKPLKWSEEVIWVSRVARSKSAKAQVVKMALAETVYAIWQVRNRILFTGKGSEGREWKEICSIVAIRSARRPALQKLMLNLDGRELELLSSC